MSPEGSNEGESGNKSAPPSPGKRKKRPGELVRAGSLYAAPSIIIVFPIVGFLIGYLPYKYWNWPFWVPITTLLLGLVQGIREIYKLSRKVYGNNDRQE